MRRLRSVRADGGFGSRRGDEERDSCVGDWIESVALLAWYVGFDVDRRPCRRGLDGDGDGDDDGDFEASLREGQFVPQHSQAAGLTELLLRLCRGLPSSSSLSSDLSSRSDVDFRFFDVLTCSGGAAELSSLSKPSLSSPPSSTAGISASVQYASRSTFNSSSTSPSSNTIIPPCPGL